MDGTIDTLEARTIDLCLVYESANLPVDADSAEALAEAVVAKATHILGAQLATFFVKESRSNSWRTAATAGHTESNVTPPGVATLHSAAMSGEISVVSDTESLHALFPACSATEAVIAPLFAGTDRHGVLCVGRADGRAFSAAQLRFYRILAMRAGPLLERALLSSALRREAITDSLTGLWNRRQLQADLEDLSTQWTEARSVSLLMFDLTSFKWLNDTFGHARGDTVLRDFGSALATHAPSGARAYRLAGDEFVVLAPDCTSTEHDRYMSALSEAMHGMGRSSDEKPLVDFDVGVAHYPSDARDADGLLRVADKRMYEMKRSRR